MTIPKEQIMQIIKENNLRKVDIVPKPLRASMVILIF